MSACCAEDVLWFAIEPSKVHPHLRVLEYLNTVQYKRYFYYIWSLMCT